MKPILNDLPFASGDEVLLFVNGMGSTPLLELVHHVPQGGRNRPCARA